MCGTCAQCFNANLYTRQNGPAPQCAPVVQSRDGNGGVHRDNNARRRIVGQNCNGAAHQFAAKLGGIICPDGKPGFEARPCDIDASRVKVVQRLADTGQHRGHNAGKNDAGNIPRLRTIERQDGPKLHSIFVCAF